VRPLTVVRSSRYLIQVPAYRGDFQYRPPKCLKFTSQQRRQCAQVRSHNTTTHHAAIIDPVKVGELLRAIGGYDGQPTTVAALRLTQYVFVRLTELRAAEWAEMNFNGEQPERRPVERMKMRETHVVPLARQAVGILRELVIITGRQRYVFPAIGGGGRPISENTLNSALRRIGY
jgi:integrase